MQLFYDSHISKKDKQFTFEKEESRHIIRVLRKKEDDSIFITNGKGFLFHSKISIASDKKCVVTIEKVVEVEDNLTYHIQIAIAPTKNNQRLEWFLEKATEIGVSEITPIICEHSERKVVKVERLQKVLVSAMKQSKRMHLPILNQAIPLKKFLENSIHQNKKFIAHCEDDDKQTLKQQLKANQDVLILIGPEGDFSLSEISLALEKGFQPISLGKSILRTETAGMVAVQSVAFINE
jgi:16S rRNA (uracil1498-N3)-methyltransferase